jgi:hypothetical protein
VFRLFAAWPVAAVDLHDLEQAALRSVAN